MLFQTTKESVMNSKRYKVAKFIIQVLDIYFDYRRNKKRNKRHKGGKE